MSSSNKRQAAASPTVLDLDHVLVAVVQCMAAVKDVKAFLAALPPSARGSTHLAALHELLQAPHRAVLAIVSKPLDALWPLLHLDKITPAATHLVRDAMPIFLAASAGTSRVARPRYLDTVEWLRLWSTKLTHYTHDVNGAVFDPSRLLNVLRQCHQLQVVDLRWAADGHEIVEAVTTPLHRVRSLKFVCSSAASIALVDRWLASGHAEHLELTQAESHEAEAMLGPMLLKTTGLSSLALHYHERGVLAPLFAIAASFDRLARLSLSIPESDVASLLPFLKHLNKPQLRSLSLYCRQADLTGLVEVLASFPKLEELELSKCAFGGRPRATMMLPLTLRRVTFRELTATKATWDVLVTGLSRAHALTELSCCWCRLQPSVVKAIAKALSNWIHRGIRNIALDACNIDDDGASAMATALRRTTSQSGVCIDLCNARLSVQSYVALGDALTTCRGVSIELRPIDCEVFRTEATRRRITYHVDSRTNRLVLESPVPHLQ
ncbi:hypothetical protein SPRG_03113 [Saprolegnia parasitica CBS 223.65]|uniref:F-box domain-containing protein n=1 Tax=Saprolegnia parasitica (strain CBS 223.65) TaxID=695850 RepID=A0A067CYL3_SAPPC|nr:hypothetical protein SPRG_03113 [Saprolegnia parasitica CBS 223.65]KDO31897.1 hypothetical protein SPRG_03113 [Saprolegnia parasitica CBS 223.65]|eukprot:XP_012197096.1 hypothetical protein SPRG_03113 [Saprolegnia parasitica CBS 223.65]